MAISESMQKTVQKRRDFLRKAKDAPCAVCGKKYHFAAMDFHHRDRNEKTFSIAAHKSYSMKRLKAEIDKCDVICANCHRIRTFEYSEHKPSIQI